MRSPNRWVVVGGVAVGALASALLVGGMSTTKKAPGSHALSTWKTPLAPVDKALRARDVAAAMRAWHPVYGAALRDHGWEGLIAVGDARLRIQRAAGASRNADGQVRQIYLTALVRAQRHGSTEGALSAAAAFATLGDREIAAEAVRIAAALDARRSAVDPGTIPSL